MVAGEAIAQAAAQLRVLVEQSQQIDQAIGGGGAQIVLEQAGFAVRPVGLDAEDVVQERARDGVAVMDLTGQALPLGREHEETMRVVDDESAPHERAETHRERGMGDAELVRHVNEARVPAARAHLPKGAQVVFVTRSELRRPAFAGEHVSVVSSP